MHWLCIPNHALTCLGHIQLAFWWKDREKERAEGRVGGSLCPVVEIKERWVVFIIQCFNIHVHTSVQAEVCIFKAAKKGLQDLESVSVFQVCHHQWGDYFICHCAPLQLHTTGTKNAQAGQVPLCTKNMQQFQIKAPLKQLSKRHSIAKLNKKNVIKKSSPGSMRAKSAFTFRGHHINK